MNTWLLTWNPIRGSGAELPKAATRVQAGKREAWNWSCGVNKSIRPGDRLFLIRLGDEPRGIVGSGFATRAPYKGRPWRGKASRKPALYVDLVWDALLRRGTESRHGQQALPLAELRRGALRKVNWQTRASGIRIPETVVSPLERRWRRHYASVAGTAPVDPPNILHPAALDLDDEISAVEGQQRKLLILHRRRERRLRVVKIREAMSYGRLVCEVPRCGFDFERVYGALGAGFAEVHHDKPLGLRTRPERTTLDQLRIVCANCHRMIHRGGECRPLARLIGRQKTRR